MGVISCYLFDIEFVQISTFSFQLIGGKKVLRIYTKVTTQNSAGPVAQGITRLTTEQKIAGSNPVRIACFQGGYLNSMLGTTKPLVPLINRQQTD